MTTLPLNRLLPIALCLLLAATSLLHGAEEPVRRVQTYAQAKKAAGDDGIIIFRYGPDWNHRSVRMLSEFWRSKALEKVSGQAILLPIPVYQAPSAKQQQQLQDITAEMPPLNTREDRICPSIIFMDKEGRIYARLCGMDDMGDETGKAALPRIKQIIYYLRTQQKYMQAALNTEGEEAAKFLGAACSLPIAPPPDVKEKLEKADPLDKLGYIHRLEFDPEDFLYSQLSISPEKFPDNIILQPLEQTHIDYDRLRARCEKIYKNEALRPEDRQMAYGILISVSRNEPRITGNKLHKMLKECERIGPSTIHGQTSSALAVYWPSLLDESHRNGRRARLAAEKKRIEAIRAKNRESRENKDESKNESKNTSSSSTPSR